MGEKNSHTYIHYIKRVPFLCHATKQDHFELLAMSLVQTGLFRPHAYSPLSPAGVLTDAFTILPIATAFFKTKN